MAGIYQVSITCDFRSCPEEFKATPGVHTVGDARADAQKAGWHRSGGKDIGPGCWDDGVRHSARDGWTVG